MEIDIWTQHCFVGGGSVEKQLNVRSLSIGLNMFCKKSVGSKEC